MNLWNLANRYRHMKRKNAFTTLELMVVIATIAILASLILPTFSKVKRSMYANQSRIQFNRYVFGLNAYYREYGYFPRIVSKETALQLDTVIALDATSSANLIRALSGKEIDGVATLTAANEYLSPSGIQFVEFSDDDFFKNTDGTIDRTRLADRFNKADIKFIVESDADTDAVIPQSAFNSFGSIKEKVPGAGLREKVVFFTIGDNDKSIDVTSWN